MRIRRNDIVRSAVDVPWGHLDVVRDGRIIATCNGWAAVVDALPMFDRGVYDVADLNGTVIAVATVSADGIWRLEGGKRHGR